MGKSLKTSKKIFKTFNELYNYLQDKILNNRKIDDEVYLVDRPVFFRLLGLEYHFSIREKEIDRIVLSDKPSTVNLPMGTFQIIGNPKYRSKLYKVLNK